MAHASEDTIQQLVINPFYAVNIAEGLCARHPPMVTKEEWVQANARLIGEMGAEAWLRRLLDVLETGGVTG